MSSDGALRLPPVAELARALLARSPGNWERLAVWRGRIHLEQLLFLHAIRPGETVFDVGANEGHHSLLFSHRVGKRGSVHAFEPVPPTFQRLVENLRRRRVFGNVTPVPAALAEREGSVELEVPGDDFGQASLRSHAAGSWAAASERSRYRARAFTLDGYVTRHEIERLDFLKCDVEGAELLVLRGAEETLARLRPVLYLELYGPWMRSFGVSPAELQEQLLTAGYSRFHRVAEGIEPLASPGPALEDGALESSANLLCSTPDRLGPGFEAMVARIGTRRGRARRTQG